MLLVKIFDSIQLAILIVLLICCSLYVVETVIVQLKLITAYITPVSYVNNYICTPCLKKPEPCDFLV